MKEMAVNIRKLRLKQKMTQAQLANKLGVQYQTVSKWENEITMPDVSMLPMLADFLDTTIDELFGRRKVGCAGTVEKNEREFLLHTYAQMYDPEAGPWNLSVQNKYLEYKFADFFENNFLIEDKTDICNIGIGAGEWDIYLSYKLKDGSLTCIDILEVCCRQLELRLLCEGNPNDVRIICADAMAVKPDKKFDIVTLVGSSVMESEMGIAFVENAMSFVKEGGAMYYQSLDEKEDCNEVLQAAYRQGMKLAAFLEDRSYGFVGHYYKFEKS